MTVLKEQILLLLFWITTSLFDILTNAFLQIVGFEWKQPKKVRDEYGTNEVWIGVLPFTPWFDDHQPLKKKIIDSHRHLA